MHEQERDKTYFWLTHTNQHLSLSQPFEAKWQQLRAVDKKNHDAKDMNHMPDHFKPYAMVKIYLYNWKAPNGIKKKIFGIL